MKNILFLLLFFSVACSSKVEEKTDVNSASKVDNSIEAEMEAIDQEVQSIEEVATSFRYTKDDGSLMLVLAYLDPKGKIIKLEQKYNNGNGKNNGKISFYFKNEQLLSTRERYDDVESAKPGFKERISYYKDKKAYQTFAKNVQFEEELDLAEFVDEKPVTLSLDVPKSVLEQRGEFETRFQGFVASQVLNYMILGSKDPNGFVTSVRVDYEDAFIKLLLANQEKFLFKKVFVEFATEIDPTGFEYQRYVSGKFLE